MQGRTAESTANWSNDPPHPPQCFKTGSALLPQISLGINFQFQGRDKDASTHTRTPGNPVTVQYFLPVSMLFPSLSLCVGVWSGWAVSLSLLHHCVGPLLSSSSSSPNDSSNNELPVDSQCRAVMKVLQCSSPSLYTRTHLSPPLINYGFLLSHRICVGDGSSVSCTSAQAPDRVSASVLKLFITVPQGISPTLQLPA